MARSVLLKKCSRATLELTLVLLVIVSRIVNSRNRSRSFPQPATAPRKAFSQKEFIELSPFVRLFVKAKSLFSHTTSAVKFTARGYISLASSLER